jgi:hypothetical protein
MLVKSFIGRSVNPNAKKINEAHYHGEDQVGTEAKLTAITVVM